MNRRNFVRNLSLATAAATTISTNSATANNGLLDAKNSFKLNYAPHFGMFENSVGKDEIDQLEFMADNGFMALEDNGMMGRSKELQTKIGETMSKLGMMMGVFVVAFDKWPPSTTLTSGDKEWRNKFVSTCKEAVEVAKRVNAKWMTVVPGNYDRSLPMGHQTSNVVESLRRGAEIFEPHGLVMVLEPLSDTPDLFMRYSDQTYALCKAVNSPSCKILFDMWHMQRNEGRLTRNMDLCWDEIAYFQIGDEPARCEPTTGEINYKNLFKHIHEKGFKGVLGMEHGNFYKGKEGELKLIEAYRQSDNF
jgi:hydroxypyruvate isomerase